MTIRINKRVEHPVGSISKRVRRFVIGSVNGGSIQPLSVLVELRQ